MSLPIFSIPLPKVGVALNNTLLVGAVESFCFFAPCWFHAQQLSISTLFEVQVPFHVENCDIVWYADNSSPCKLYLAWFGPLRFYVILSKNNYKVVFNLLCQMSVNARGFWKSMSSSSGRASSLIGLCNALFFPFLFFFSFAFSPALWGMWAKAIFLICPQTSWILWDIPRDFRLFRQHHYSHRFRTNSNKLCDFRMP